MDVENGSSESSKAEQETLYLIYKYLDSLTPCKEASAKLKEELQRNFLLGDVHSWDGSHKKADIKDMDRKYSHVPNDMLLTLLRNSSAVEVPTKHSSIINCVSTSSKDPSVEDLSTYHDLVVRLSALSVDQSTHRTAIAKTEAKLRKLNDLIQLHTNFDYESNEGHPPEIDTSSFLTHLTAKDYEQIYAKDPSCDSTPSSQCLSKQQRTAELVSAIRSLEKIREEVQESSLNQNNMDQQMSTKQQEYSELECQLSAAEGDSREQEAHKSATLNAAARERHAALLNRLEVAQTYVDKCKGELAAASAHTEVGEKSLPIEESIVATNYKNSTLYIMKLAGMTKERNRLEESLSVMKENIAARYVSSRAAIVSDLASKRHFNTALAKRFHGVCDNGIDRWRAKSMGVSRYGIRTDLRGMWPSNRASLRIGVPASASAGVDEQYKKLWTSSGHLLHPAYTAVIDRLGRFAITGSDDYLVKIWDIETGLLVRTCRGHKGPIVNVVLSPDNTLMASACMEGTVRLWRLVDGRCLKIWRHGSQVNCLTFDTLTCALIYGGEDGNCMVWDLSSLLYEEDEDDEDALDEPPPAGVVLAGLATGQGNDPIDVDQPVEQGGGCSQRKERRLRFTGRYPLLECALEDMNERVRQRLINSKKSVDNGLSFVEPEESVSACSLSSLLVKKGFELTDVVTSITPTTSSCAQDTSLPNISSVSLTANQEAQLRTNSELFSWNFAKQRDSSGHHLLASTSGIHSQFKPPTRSLCLPHINADLKGDKISVESMDMCSVNSLLVTGGSDGIARVWRLNEPTAALNHQLQKLDPDTDWSQVPGDEGMLTAKRREKEKHDLDILRALNPSVCDRSKIEKLETVAYRQLCRLEGHVSAVTDVQFSHAGDRILTGSWKKDGTVRIWTFSKDFLKHDHMILSINENDIVGGDEFNSGRGGRGRGPRQSNKPQIHNVYWSCDDATILVVHSFIPPPLEREEVTEYCQTKREGTRLRVYNSTTGQLVKMITISLQKCHVLACHPSNPHLAFTAGKEGVMSVWNVLTGDRVSQHLNLCPQGGLIVDDALVKEGSPLEIVDGKFSYDGLRIAATDVVGRVIILGNDNPRRYLNVHETQYFLSDYSTVIHDRQGWPIDADSQLPLHHAPVGPLCRTDCTPYANQPTCFPLPQPLCKEVAAANLKELLYWRDKYPSTVSRAYNAHKKYMQRIGDNPVLMAAPLAASPRMGGAGSAVAGSFTRPSNTGRPRRPRGPAQPQVDYFRRRFKRSRYENSREMHSYREESDSGSEGLAMVDENSDEEALEDDSDSEESEEEEFEEEFERPNTRGVSKAKAKKNLRGRELRRGGQINRVTRSNRGRPRKEKKLKIPRSISCSEVVDGLNIIANCTGCGTVGVYCHSTSHRMTDEITGEVMSCGKFTVDPRDGLLDEMRDKYVANCSGCGQLGLFKKFMPPSKAIFFKPHMIKQIGAGGEVTVHKCGEFFSNPRKGTAVSDVDWERSKVALSSGDISSSSSLSSSLSLPMSMYSDTNYADNTSIDLIEEKAIAIETGSEVGSALEQNGFEKALCAFFASGSEDAEIESEEEVQGYGRLVYPIKRRSQSESDTSSGNDSDGLESSGQMSEDDKAVRKAVVVIKRKAVQKPPKVVEKSNVIAPWAQHNGHRTVPLTAKIDSAWLQAEESIEQQYIPQLGDKVIYFPQGHMEHLQAMPESSSPPWFTYHSQLRHLLKSDGLGGSGKWPCVECKVVDFWYNFPKSSEYKKCTSAMVEIELEITGVPQCAMSNYTTAHLASGNIYTKFTPVPKVQGDAISFSVTLRNLNLPDFLVPSYLYMQAGIVQWKKGTKFQTFFKEDDPADGDVDTEQWKSYPGVVVRSSDFEDEWLGSPWNSLEIIWAESLSRIVDENRIERISPWDARVQDDEMFKEQCKKNPLCVPPKLPRRVTLSLIDKITEVMTMETFEPFSYPIDSQVFADYYCIIPCNMYLELIKDRLESNFYRQIEALQRDIAQILRNCEQYNQEGSSIIADAEKLVQLLNEAMRVATAAAGGDDDADGFDHVAVQNGRSGCGSSSSSVMETPVVHPVAAASSSSSSTSASGEQPRSSSEQLRLRFRNNAARQRSPGSNDLVGMPPPVPPTTILELSETLSSRRSGRNRSNVEPTGAVVGAVTVGAIESNTNTRQSKRKRDSVESIEAQSTQVSSHSTGRSRRGPATTRYTEVDSEEDGEEDEEEEEEEQEAEEVSGGRRTSDRRSGASRTGRAVATPPRKSSRRGAATRTSAVRRDEDSEEEDEADEHDEVETGVPSESDEEVSGGRRTSGRRAGTSRAGRTAAPSHRSSTRRRAATQASAVKRDVESDEDDEEEEGGGNNDTGRRGGASSSSRHTQSKEVMQCMHDIVDFCAGLDEEGFFMYPVSDEVAPGYSEIITQPMDYSLIRNKLKASKYRSTQQLANDIMLIYDNCQLYNQDDSELFKLAKKQRREAKKMLQNYGI